MPLDPHLAAVLTSLAAPGQKAFHEGTVAEARAAFNALAVGTRTPDQVVPVASVEDITVPGAAGDLQARVYRPEGEGPFPTIAFFHGGGWVLGGLDPFDNMARDIARGCRAMVVAVDYRLAPEAPFPAPVLDAIAAGRWIAAHAKDFGGTEVFAVAGDSAGGNMAAVLTQVLRADSVAVRAQLLIYPTTDPATAYPSRSEGGPGLVDSATIEWFFDQYVGGAGFDPSDPRLAPLHAPDLGGLPPTVIATAEFDPLRDDGEAYAQKLQAAGVRVHHTRYGGLIHGFFDFGRWSPGAQAAIEDITATFGALLRD